MTNQRKWLVVVGLFVAWGAMMVYQMSDSIPNGSDNPFCTFGNLSSPIKRSRIRQHIS
jgi:hypothetical protein